MLFFAVRHDAATCHHAIRRLRRYFAAMLLQSDIYALSAMIRCRFALIQRAAIDITPPCYAFTLFDFIAAAAFDVFDAIDLRLRHYADVTRCCCDYAIAAAGIDMLMLTRVSALFHDAFGC